MRYDEPGVTLYCGDAREVLASLSIPDDAGWIVDPPWDADAVVWPGLRKLVFCDGWRQNGVIRLYGAPSWIFTWDCVSSWYVRNRPLRRVKFAFWYGPVVEFSDGAVRDGRPPGPPRIVTNTRGSYLHQPDPRGRRLSDLYVEPITRVHQGSSHEKPLPWLRLLIGSCLSRCPLIVDPFMGSGAAVVAARSIGIPVVGIDHDPAQFDRAVRALAQSEIIVDPPGSMQSCIPGAAAPPARDGSGE